MAQTAEVSVKEWREGGVLHREDGPARQLGDGTKMWYKIGKLHRDDGPAVLRADGGREWWQTTSSTERTGRPSNGKVAPIGIGTGCSIERMAQPAAFQMA